MMSIMSHCESLLQANQISATFQGKKVLDNISLSILPKQIVTLIGPNGAGKTTLVRILLGLMQPEAGLIIKKMHLRIGYAPQRLVIGPELPLTVERFLQCATASITHIMASLTEVGIPGLQKQAMHSLSGGEFQRVLLARALINNPELIVLDEPLQGVDAAGQAELYGLITKIREERACSILLVSHDLHFVMATTDEVICLNHHVCCSGHPEAVSQHPEFRALFAIYAHSHDHRHH